MIRYLGGLLAICLSVFYGTPAFGQKKSTDSTKRKLDVTGIPILSYNNSYGVIVGAMGMGFFNLSKKDTISPASQVGTALGYTQNKSWFGFLFGQLYFKEDKWRIATVGGVGDMNFQYFDEVAETGEGDFVDFNSESKFFFFRALRKIKGHLYGGLFVKLQHSYTTFANSETAEDVNINGLGASVLFDSRNTVYNPSDGIQASL